MAERPLPVPSNVPGESDADCLLLGGDNGHFTQHSFPGLLPACEAAGLTVDFITKGPALTASRLAGKKLCIIFADGYTQVPVEFEGEDGEVVERFGPTWMAPEQEQALEEFVLAGGAFMPIHNSMWAYPIGPHPTYDPEAQLAELTAVQGLLRDSERLTTTEEVGLADEAAMGPYRRLCGGVGGYHPAFEAFDVLVTDPDHPIAEGVSDFRVHDEQHYVFLDAHKGARAFLTNRGSDGRESCAGYSFVHGRGRVCFLAPGHVPLTSRRHPGQTIPDGEPDAISHPMVQRLFHNAVRWLAAGPEPEPKL